jgi:hypothetical protein
MKKIIAALIILAVCSAGILSASAQRLVFANQTITVEPSQLSIESVEYHPAASLTNTVTRWVETNAVYVGGALENYATATNTVSQQVSSEEVTATAATWICNVIVALPPGYPWEINGFPLTIERFRAVLAVPVDPAVVTAAVGPAAAGLEFAAQNGAYAPTGQVKDAFLSFAAAVLAGGAE